MKKNLINKMRMQLIKGLVFGVSTAVVLAGCSASGDNQGVEYAPNMYHSVPYDPLTQVVDKDAGQWLTSIDYDDGHGEFFNSNPLNIRVMNSHMNMRTPPPNTVKRNKYGWLPYRLEKDSLVQAAKIKNPLDSTASLIANGKALYDMYCDHCHGAKGAGDGKVAEKYAGVPNYNSDALKNITEGHIFHVITHGKGLMWAHGSQLHPDERWAIAKYVKTLQK
jgi:mono/diheme cytochrome c family protein